jgi:hypothetical protein
MRLSTANQHKRPENRMKGTAENKSIRWAFEAAAGLTPLRKGF